MAIVCDEMKAMSAKSDRETLKFAACVGLDLSEHEENWLTEEVLSIYCRARDTQEERIDLMRSALQWRAEHREQITSLVCPTCKADPRSHDARLFGADPNGDPVLMNCFQLPRDLTPQNLNTHMICLFERALRDLPANPNELVSPEDGHARVRQWTWIIDLYGFGVRHTNPKTSYNLITLLQTAYRGRLKRLVLLDAPTGFAPFYENVAKPFMKPATANRLEFVPLVEAKKRFTQLFEQEMTDALMKEIEENRQEDWENKSWTTFYGGLQCPCE